MIKVFEKIKKLEKLEKFANLKNFSEQFDCFSLTRAQGTNELLGKFLEQHEENDCESRQHASSGRLL